MDLQQNTLFDNRYLLKKMLGSGGFSEVWLVEDTKVGNKKMALKVYAPGKGLDEDGVQLFSSEFELVYDLNHTHLLRPSHYDVCDRSPYLLMPFCERGSANKLVGKLTEEQAWHFLHDVASGLAHLHKQEPPIIHQDIKPDNVLIDHLGHFLITDFGISTKARSTLRKSVGDTKSGAGTIAYMGPERFGKNNEAIKSSDMWALGATLFEMMTEDPPFGEHGGLVQKSGAEIPDISGEWSNDLLEIVNQCLQIEPWNRPMAFKIVEWTEEHFKGNKLSMGNESMTCSKCGKAITVHNKFCPYCGASQKVGGTAPPMKDKTAPSIKDKTSPPQKPSNKKMWFGITGGALILILATIIILALNSKPDTSEEPIAITDVYDIPDEQEMNDETALSPISPPLPDKPLPAESSPEPKIVDKKAEQEQQRQAELEQRRQTAALAREERLSMYEYVGDWRYKLGSVYMLVRKKTGEKPWGIIDNDGNIVIDFDYREPSRDPLIGDVQALYKKNHGWDVFNRDARKIESGLQTLTNYLSD